MARPFKLELTEFERAWQERGEPVIEQFLSGWSGAERIKLIKELIWLDLDYRLRKLSFSCMHTFESMTTPRLSDESIPSLEEYWARFPELEAINDITVDCIGEEYEARLRHGMPTSLEMFLNRFSQHGEELRRHLRGIESYLDSLEPLYRVAVYHNGALNTVVRFCAILEVGRQQRGEPEPFCRHETYRVTRLIVAPYGERRIARKHLLCQANGRNTLRITNISRKSQLAINDTIVMPGHSEVADLPCELRLGELVMKCSKCE